MDAQLLRHSQPTDFANFLCATFWGSVVYSVVLDRIIALYHMINRIPCACVGVFLARLSCVYVFCCCCLGKAVEGVVDEDKRGQGGHLGQRKKNQQSPQDGRHVITVTTRHAGRRLIGFRAPLVFVVDFVCLASLRFAARMFCIREART